MMQVHQKPRAASALALAGKYWNKKQMQTHAPDACAAKKTEKHLKTSRGSLSPASSVFK
ncbi:hypothetical protein AB4O84_09100 [Citrobacter freundii]|uniref:hypothetical protein n=1 Tax=Citrobacter freundii TaxID=546 RepID=UPI002359F858|nr:hypothetical protein [Citrobacter freundii]MDC8907549.1 hypothetical protein [Citrobacter freundii]